MKTKPLHLGFSLVEILVSLIVVSLVAVNTSGLQKLVAEQSRDNFSHASVIGLVTEQFEKIMLWDNLQDIIALNGTSAEYNLRGTLFTLTWRVEGVSGASNMSPVRYVEASITWLNASGEIQVFTHAEQMSQAMLMGGGSESNGGKFPYIIPNRLNTTKVDYFESTMRYEKDAYVIYDSQLFQASDFHSLDSGNLQPPPINATGEISSGWVKLGSIDDVTLASLFVD